MGDTTPLALAFARIRGIDSQFVVAKWLEVEHKLERGPRESVVEKLQQRHRYLEDHGERELPEWSPEECRDRAESLSSESVAEWPEREGNERTPAFVSGSSLSREGLAADGGDEQ